MCAFRGIYFRLAPKVIFSSMAPRRHVGAFAALVTAALVTALYVQYRKKKKDAAPAARMSRNELTSRLVELGKSRVSGRDSFQGESSPTSPPPPLTSGDSSKSPLVPGRRRNSAGAGTAIAEEEEEGDGDGLRSSAEKELWRRVEAVLAEYSLNRIAMVAARKWVREMGDPTKTELRRLRDWLLAKVNGRDRVAPVSSWQSGCPEILGGLRATPVWPADTFACLQPFVKHAGEITKELLALREAQLSGFQPLKIPNWATKHKVTSPDGAGSLSHDAGDWNVFYLALHEVPFEANCGRCPTTSRLLRDLPRSYQHAFFSALTPGTHILKHHGPTNKKLRVHLPLVGVEGAELRVADRVLTFQPGAPVVFDDSFEHEAWHRGPETRVVLVFDLWHPDLSDREVFFLSFLQRSRMRADMRAEKALRQGREDEPQPAQPGALDAGDNFYQLLHDSKGVLPDNKWWV